MIRFAALGDSALVVTLGGEASAHTSRRVHAVAARLERATLPGVRECVPGYVSVTVHYDPAGVSPAAEDGPYEVVVRAVSRLLGGPLPDESRAGQTVEVPVCYGGDFGPDLQRVAAANGLSADDVIGLHSRGRYLVHLVGFLPGFPYMGGLPEALATPRLPTPRALVPAGSVAIAGRQTGIYPTDSPGGWNVVGRTPVRLFDPGREPPALLGPGDEVRFRPMTLAEFTAWKGDA